MSQSIDHSKPASLPASAVLGISIAILFLGLFTLEISDGLNREHLRIARRLYFFPPTLLLIVGMLRKWRWALLAARLAAVLGSLWFFGWSVAASVLRPVDQYGPVWIWIMCVSLVLGGLLLLAFFGLGRKSTKRHYGLLCPHCQNVSCGWRTYFARRLHCVNCGTSWQS